MARGQAIRLVRHFDGESVWMGSAARVDRRGRDADIRRMLESGKSVAEVATASGLSASQVRRIRGSG
jgi:Mor family transcriptional regulator